MNSINLKQFINQVNKTMSVTWNSYCFLRETVFSEFILLISSDCVGLGLDSEIYHSLDIKYTQNATCNNTRIIVINYIAQRKLSFLTQNDSFIIEKNEKDYKSMNLVKMRKIILTVAKNRCYKLRTSNYLSDF